MSVNKSNSLIGLSLNKTNLRKLVRKPYFARLYLAASLFILLLTTLFWSIKSAAIHASNADQLVDPYLFSSNKVFHGALFPQSHTFIIKWPVFFVIRLLNFSSFSYSFFTVLIALLTVGCLAYLLYRVERRPIMLGTLLLALASVLLLVPAQPYPGGLLPVNIAMLAARNIEYVIYLGGLILLIRAKRLKSLQYLLAVVLLAIVFASDQLFLVMSLGGSLILLVICGLAGKHNQSHQAARWTVGSVLGGALAYIGLRLLVVLKVTHIAGGSTVGPYSLVSNFHSVGLGLVYGVLGFLTNLGANPANDTTYLRQLPGHSLSHIFSYRGPAIVINLVIAGVLARALLWLIRASLTKTTHPLKHNTASELALMLVSSIVAVWAAFVFTNHYYASDARYLTISLLAGFFALAVYTRQRSWAAEKVVVVGFIILVGLVFGLLAASNNYHIETNALAGIKARNEAVVDSLQHKNGFVLVGDYWRVLPIKQEYGSSLPIMPMTSCNQPRLALSSTAWQPNLNKQGFQYLLSLDKGLTDYPACSLGDIKQKFGNPNSSTLISGSLEKPSELLLNYEDGAHASAPVHEASGKSSTILPVSLSDLPYMPCDKPTLLTAVAHEDDDLLFMNPDNLHAIEAGDCIRSIYVTAGDGGYGNNYFWLSREQGIEAAYSSMARLNNPIWEDRLVKLSNHEYIVIANPRGNLNISLIFMRLPDGNLKGQGFKANDFESLAGLESHRVSALHSLDGQSYYGDSDLVSALDTLLHYYQPSEIHTQANYVSVRFPDHSDHMAVGRYMKRAYANYESEEYNNQVAIPIKFYIGYPIQAFPPNETNPNDLQSSVSAYLAYSKYDNTACKSLTQCDTESTFGKYLDREYTNPY